MKCNRSSCENEMHSPRLNIIVWDEVEGSYGGNFCSYPCAIMSVGDAMVFISEGNSLADWTEGPAIVGTTIDDLDTVVSDVKLIPNQDPGPFPGLPESDEELEKLLDEAEAVQQAHELEPEEEAAQQLEPEEEEEEEYPEEVIKLIISAEFIDKVLPELYLKLGAHAMVQSDHIFSCEGNEYEYKAFDFAWKNIKFSVRPSWTSPLQVFFDANNYSMDMLENEKLTPTIAAETIAAHAHSIVAMLPKVAQAGGF